MSCHAALRRGEFERRLEATRREVTHAIQTADIELAGLEDERPGDDLDGGVRNLACDVLAKLEERDHAALAEIRAAEARLAAGTYGVCEGCARRIPRTRLRTLLTTRLCVDCEAALETARP